MVDKKSFNEPHTTDYGMILWITFIVLFWLVVLIMMYFIPYGDHSIQYGSIGGTSHYIDSNGEYHMKGLLNVKNCGTFVDHMFGISVRDFKVNDTIFANSLGGKTTRFTYECIDGVPSNFNYYSF